MLKKLFVWPFLSHPERNVVKPPPSSIQELRFNAWFADNGDRTHRLIYDLKPDSVVLDLGGYRGDWAAEIFCRYACNIKIFEPVKDFAEFIRQRFAWNPKVKIYQFGLSNKDEKVCMSLNGSSTSSYKQATTNEEVEMKEAASFLLNHMVLTRISLMKVNIEGGEYDLLDHLLDAGLVSAIENLQIQFHDFVPDAESRMRSIQSKLAKTHNLTYQYEFVWENWRFKNTETAE